MRLSSNCLEIFLNLSTSLFEDIFHIGDCQIREEKMSSILIERPWRQTFCIGDNAVQSADIENGTRQKLISGVEV